MFLERWNIKPKEWRCFSRYETYFPYQIDQNVENWNSKLIKKGTLCIQTRKWNPFKNLYIYIILLEMCCVSVYRIIIP